MQILNVPWINNRTAVLDSKMIGSKIVIREYSFWDNKDYQKV